MATGQFFNPPLRHIGRATASGTFVVPASVSKVFVIVSGARGGTSQANGQPGASLANGGWVEVLPGSTAQLVVGAGGTSSQQGTAGGTTSFDGAITVTGSSGASWDSRYGASNGGVGTRSDSSTLPTGSPAGAIARVSSSQTSGPTDIATSGSGVINIYA